MRVKTFVSNLHFVGDEKTEDGKIFNVMVMDLLDKVWKTFFKNATAIRFEECLLYCKLSGIHNISYPFYRFKEL